MLGWLTLALLACAAIPALLVSIGRAGHRPIAVYLSGVLLANVARFFLLSRFDLLRPLDAPPLAGVARVAFHVDEALFMVWAFGLAATTLAVFVGRAWALLPALAWVATAAYLSTHYPEIRGQSLRDVYAAAEIAALCVAVGALVTWTWRREPPGVEHVCALLITLLDGAATLAGSLKWGLFTRYDLDQIASAVLYTLLSGFQVYAWRQRRSRSD